MTDRILSSIVIQLDENRKNATRRAPGSSIELPVINEQETRQRLKKLLIELQENNSTDEIIDSLKQAVLDIKQRYVRSHDGFRKAKGVGADLFISVGKIYTFSLAASYLFDALLPALPDKAMSRIGIGVMAPAVQDCGKNLIKMVWQGGGYQVIDLGNKVKPEKFIEVINEQHLQAIGISCMVSKSQQGLISLLKILKAEEIGIPIIIGGIAVNNMIAMELSQSYGLPVYYGRDINDAEHVLKRAMAGNFEYDQNINSVNRMDCLEVIGINSKANFMVYPLAIDEIVIDLDARASCYECAGVKKMMCPLEIGYEHVRTLEESTSFINSYEQAFLVATDLPNVDDNQQCKSVWLDLLEIEQKLAREYGEAYAFKLPLICPFCKPAECKLGKGFCTYEGYYRPLHESYNINIGSICSNFINGVLPGIYSLVLVRG